MPQELIVSRQDEHESPWGHDRQLRPAAETPILER